MVLCTFGPAFPHLVGVPIRIQGFKAGKTFFPKKDKARLRSSTLLTFWMINTVSMFGTQGSQGYSAELAHGSDVSALSVSRRPLFDQNCPAMQSTVPPSIFRQVL